MPKLYPKVFHRDDIALHVLMNTKTQMHPWHHQNSTSLERIMKKSSFLGLFVGTYLWCFLLLLRVLVSCIVLSSLVGTFFVAVSNLSTEKLSIFIL